MAARADAERLANPTLRRSRVPLVPSGSLSAVGSARLAAIEPRRALPWAVVLGASAYLALSGAWQLVAWPFDWNVLAQLPDRIRDGSLYAFDPSYNYVWSPTMAAILATVVIPVGYWAWFALHVMCLAFLRDGRMIALALLSLSLWVDAGLGNTVVFVVVAGILALRGSRVGEVAFVALFALVPRPVQLPLLVWLLWRRPHLRIPFVLVSGCVLASAAAVGLLDDWVTAAAGLAMAATTGPANFGPTAAIGLGWYAIAIPAATLLTVRGHVGTAGLLISPYLYPQYLLFLLFDIHERRRLQVDGIAVTRRRSDPAVGSPAVVAA
jgi:hypothetical protein